MSNNNHAVATKESFVIEMPDNSPALGFDPMADNFDWTDVLPDNYWSMEALSERKEALGGWPALTPDRMVLQPVYDPTDDEDKRDMSPKLVMYFKESSPALVFNKSRCQMASQYTGTRNPRLWAERLSMIELRNDIYNNKAQIVFEPIEPVKDDGIPF